MEKSPNELKRGTLSYIMQAQETHNIGEMINIK